VTEQLIIVVVETKLVDRLGIHGPVARRGRAVRVAGDREEAGESRRESDATNDI
jgi:hypothetical protein